MIRTAEVIRLAAAAAILTVAVGAGTAMAAPADGMQVADTTVSEKVAETAAPAAGCARKVKVVYAGYGEASRAGCVASVAASR